MISTTTDFDLETAWERTMLGYVVPLMPLVAGEGGLDLRTKTVTIVMTEAISDQGTEELRDKLLPLLFGAAWKILDLAVELALSTARVPQSGNRWRISDKVQKASQHCGSLVAFSGAPQLWRALESVYDRTAETRHALVHRRVSIDSSTRALIGADAAGSVLPSVSYQEQLALCRCAQRLGDAITTGALPPRSKADLVAQLGLLHRYQHVLAAAATSPLRLVRLVDDFPTDGLVDVPGLLATARRTFEGAAYVDIELHLQDGRVLRGELEEAPNEPVKVDPDALPPWLSLV